MAWPRQQSGEIITSRKARPADGVMPALQLDQGQAEYLSDAGLTASKTAVVPDNCPQKLWTTLCKKRGNPAPLQYFQ